MFTFPTLHFHKYRAVPIAFDGTTDWLNIGASYTGEANSKLITLSGWIKMNSGADGSSRRIFQIADAHNSTFIGFALMKAADNTFQVLGRNTGNDLNLDMETSVDTAQVADGWNHFLMSCDMADSGNRHIYLNDVSDLSVNTYDNYTVDMTKDDAIIGRNGAAYVEMDIADFWCFPGVYIDFSVEANRRLFIDANAKPVDLGPTGAYPTGSAPPFYFSRRFNTWATNKGTGGGMTDGGSIAEAASGPSA